MGDAHLGIVTPLIAYPLTYKICLELQGCKRGGKRKTPNVVSRSVEGEYIATPTPTYSEDVEHELEAIPVPTFIEEETERPRESGVRTVER